MNNNTYDAVIIGGSLEGCVIALAHAKKGRKAIVLEHSGSLGGLATQGLCTLFEETQVLVPEALTIIKEIYPDAPIEGNAVQSFIFDDQRLKLHLMEALVKAGVEVLLHVEFSSFILSEKNKILGANMDGKTGTFVVHGKEFYDASDTQVTARGLVNNTFPISAAMKLNGVDIKNLEQYLKEVTQVERGFWGILEFPFEQVINQITCTSNDISVFVDRELEQVILFDCVSAYSPTNDMFGVSQVQLVMRGACQNLMVELRNNKPVFKNAKIIHVGPRLNMYSSCKKRDNPNVDKNLIVSCVDIIPFSVKRAFIKGWDIVSEEVLN